MTREEWQRIKRIAAGALALGEPAARQSFVAAECGEDRALFSEVDSLLRSTARVR